MTLRPPSDPLRARRPRAPARGAPVCAGPLAVLLAVLLGAALGACGSSQALTVQVPARTLYFEALTLEDQEL